MGGVYCENCDIAEQTVPGSPGAEESRRRCARDRPRDRGAPVGRLGGAHGCERLRVDGARGPHHPRAAGHAARAVLRPRASSSRSRRSRASSARTRPGRDSSRASRSSPCSGGRGSRTPGSPTRPAPTRALGAGRRCSRRWRALLIASLAVPHAFGATHWSSASPTSACASLHLGAVPRRSRAATPELHRRRAPARGRRSCRPRCCWSSPALVDGLPRATSAGCSR